MSTVPGCTKDTCPASLSIYTYAPSLSANSTFFALFLASFIVHAFQGIIYHCRKYHKVSLWSYSLPNVLGCICEGIGYVGRIMLHYDPFGENGFYIQICCLTIAPAFFSASIYFCLGDIITLFDPASASPRARNSDLRGDDETIAPPPPAHQRISRFNNPKKTLASIFIPCDVLSLILQGMGGGMAAMSIDKGENSTENKVGTNLMIAGLVWQVVSLSGFLSLTLDFAVRVYMRRKQATSSSPSVYNNDSVPSRNNTNFSDSSETVCDFYQVELKGSKTMQSTATGSVYSKEFGSNNNNNNNRYGPSMPALVPFLAFAIPLGLAFICIFVRCAYRVAELSGGWSGDMMHDEVPFVVFEGV